MGGWKFLRFFPNWPEHLFTRREGDNENDRVSERERGEAAHLPNHLLPPDAAAP